MPEPCASGQQALDKRRGEPRLKVGTAPSWRVAVNLNGQLRPATPLDVSADGIRLAFDRPVRPGDLLTVELAAVTSGPFSWTRLLRVIHVHRLSVGGCVAGCQFSTPLSYSQMQTIRW